MPAPPWLLAFQHDQLLVTEAPTLATTADFRLPADLEATALPIGLHDDRLALALHLPNDFAAPPHLKPATLRALYGLLGEEIFVFAGRAFQILEWQRNHRFCGRCGAETGPGPEELAFTCPGCGQHHFPRITPAVIFLVHRGEEALLARSPGFRPGGYSTLAGFVEPGETLETAVRREAHEEVGVRLADVVYYGSQPWPFPHSLMIGFTATYDGGDVVCQEGEIEDARWFHVDGLPPVSQKLSIARRLVEWFVARHGRDPRVLRSAWGD